MSIQPKSPPAPLPVPGSAAAAHLDVAALLQTLDPTAALVQRNLWLIALMQWIRGPRPDLLASELRVEYLMDTLDAHPAKRVQMQDWWCALIDDQDIASLLSDYGFATRNAFITELMERLHNKLLPATPETRDGSELFALVLSDAGDAQWIAALPVPLLARLARLLTLPTSTPIAATLRPLTCWQNALLEACTFCISQIRAASFSPDLRLRMSATTRESSPFHALSARFETVRDAWLLGGDGVAEMALFRTQMELCRRAVASVYVHLDEHGISMDMVFRLRQMRERMLRIRSLMDCLLNDADHQYSASLISQMAGLGQQQRTLAGQQLGAGG